MPALREVQQVISRLRASLDDLNRLVETRDATIKDLRGELVLRIEELSQARADLADARRCGPLARAYEELSKLPSPAAIAAERLENTLQQDALRKQLARAEACNAGLRREVEGHLAALSRIAVKLDVPAQGQWQPIEERIDVLCDLVGVTRTARGGDLLSGVQRLVKRDDESHPFSVGLHKVRAALGMGDDTPVADVVDRMRRVAEGQDAVRVGLRRQIDELSARVAELTAELASSNGAGGLHACENLRLEQENKLLAERLGIAYGREIDARRELADARILLDIALKQARQPVKQAADGDAP